MPPAARITDMHTCPMTTGPVPHVGGPILPPGVPTVLIDFLPAAIVTSMATCVGPPDVIVKGSSGVFINFLPAARMGDQTAHGGVIVLGSPTCIIGEVGSGSPGAAGMAGVVAGLAVSGVAGQFVANKSVYSKPGSAGTSNMATDVAALEKFEVNGIKAVRVRPGTNGKVAVVGRDMTNVVQPYADGLSKECPVETFSGDMISEEAETEWQKLADQYAPNRIPDDETLKSKMFQENQAWAHKLADQGYTVADVDDPMNKGASPFCEMENQTLFGDGSAGGAK
jgi:uncharacterized Zn-binding protein involved in type VI secretion